MKLSLDLHPAVRDETAEAYAWYEQRQAGLGSAFLDEVERVLTEISGHPERYGFADADIREGALPDRIRVLAVFHSSRDPAVWRSRA